MYINPTKVFDKLNIENLDNKDILKKLIEFL